MMQRLCHSRTRRARRWSKQPKAVARVSRAIDLESAESLFGLSFSLGLVALFAPAAIALVSLVHILDNTFENQKVRRRPAIDLDRASIIPLDSSFDLFTIPEDDDHQRVRVNLFLVVEDFRVRLIRRRHALAHLHRWCRILRRTLRRGTTGVMTRPATIIHALSLLRQIAPFAFDFG